MMSSKPTPKLPKWIFFLTDAILILTAWLIADRSHGPLSSAAVFGIVACVICGAIIGTIPLILHYEQVKNETLDDRQRALEALSSTLTAAAEQIGIAAQGLHEIAELSQKNLKQAEQLPKQLQEKIGDVRSQLSAGRDEERDELKKELAALRAVDRDRLVANADKVQKSAADLAKFDTAVQKSIAAAQAELAKLPAALSAASAAALADIDAKLAARSAAALAAIEAAEVKRPRRKAEEAPAASAEPKLEAPSENSGTGRITPPEVGTQIQPIVPPTSAPFAGNIISLSEPPKAEAKEPIATATEESTPAAAAPVATASAEPAPAATSASETIATLEEPKPAKKRAPRKPKAPEAGETGLDLGITEPSTATTNGEFNQTSDEGAPAVASEAAISSDGSTRLLVTAYIGIGNRLFIRGDGPGLSWDKGVPLQFVSIGKWRWESADATAPVTFKLFKNDETECASLGSRSLEAGRQQEVTATF
jgi:hypothetical protein